MKEIQRIEEFKKKNTRGFRRCSSAQDRTWNGVCGGCGWLWCWLRGGLTCSLATPTNREGVTTPRRNQFYNHTLCTYIYRYVENHAYLNVLSQQHKRPKRKNPTYFICVVTFFNHFPSILSIYYT